MTIKKTFLVLIITTFHIGFSQILFASEPEEDHDALELSKALI